MNGNNEGDISQKLSSRIRCKVYAQELCDDVTVAFVHSVPEDDGCVGNWPIF